MPAVGRAGKGAGMNSDVMLVTGIVVALMAVPAMLSAWSDGRVPRAAAIMVMIASGLVVAALWARPGGYTVADVPDAFLRVIRMLGR